MTDSNEANTVTPTINPTNSNSGNSPPSNNNSYDPHAGRRLLSSSYRIFNSPVEMGDRYVTFLLKNERTMSALQSHVLMDHLAIVRQLGGDGSHMNLDNFGTFGDAAVSSSTQNSDSMMGGSSEEKKKRCANASIEIDAFQLLSLDPVLGNLTLRYPDTLLELLEDSTVQARQVLRRRMEAAIQSSLDKMKRQKTDMSIKNEVYKKEVNNMMQMLKALQHTASSYDPRPLHARLVHLPPHMQFCKPTLSSISSADVGTVVQICGTCVRTGPVRMMETIRTYQCLGKGCGHTFSVNADFGTTNNALPQPIVCPRPAGECDSTSFAVVADGSEHADYQEMKVQESASALNRVGSVPRSILIKLSDDLVDKCNPGDEVVVVGSLHAEWQNHSLGPNVEVMVGMSMRAHSVRVINIDEEMTGGGGTASMADLGLMGGSGMRDAAAAMAASSGNLREKFRREFDAFWSDAGAKRHAIATRDYIARAVCPKLYGMHAVKLGLLLVLIGGASVSSAEGSTEEEGNDDDDKERNEEIQVIDSDEEAPVAFKIGGDENDDDFMEQNKKRPKDGKHKKSNKNGKTIKSRRRIQSHVLLIGDPGTGKSQFLRFAAALSPRSVLTTGTGSSTAGLTCAAVRDGSSGSSGNEFSLEAGALALADRGVCCIDEFGCMSKEDRTSIHEAMEQQTISVAKAGIICKLNARATVVAVMNPKDGIYDAKESLGHNSRLGSALLSRFDLIFVMLDQAECTRDLNIANFLLQQSITPGSGYDRPLEIETLFNDDNANGHWGMEKLRAYIAAIREKFHPTLTPEASELLENHYSLCRQQRNGQSLITVRFLESLIRLSQAHARLMYRDRVLLDDAVAVILLMECTAAASSGGVFGGGGGPSYDSQSDVNLQKNPVDTEFRPFDAADAMFEKEKQTLLRRYASGSRPNNDGMAQQSNGVSPPPFRNRRESKFQSWDDVGQHDVQHHPSSSRNDQGRNDLRDQWGRQMLSQATSPHPSSRNHSVRQAIEEMGANQYTPASSHGSSRHHSENRVTFSQEGTVDSRAEMHQSFHVNSNTYRDNGHYSRGRSGNNIRQCDAPMPRQQGHFPFHGGGNPNGQYFGPPTEHERSQSGGFLRQDDGGQIPAQARTYTQEWAMGHGHAVPPSQNVESFGTSAHGNHVGPGEPSTRPMSQQSSSGKRRKKRRTAD